MYFKWCGYFYWKCVLGISNVKILVKNEKNLLVLVGYIFDKNNVLYKKEIGYYIVVNVKGNNVRDGYLINLRIIGVLFNNVMIKYDGVYCINGYRWIIYIVNNG